MEVLEEEEEGWWRGRIGAHEGVFPSNFVEEIQEEEEPPKQPPRHVTPEAPPPVDSQTGERREYRQGEYPSWTRAHFSTLLKGAYSLE